MDVEVVVEVEVHVTSIAAGAEFAKATHSTLPCVKLSTTGS